MAEIGGLFGNEYTFSDEFVSYDSKIESIRKVEFTRLRDIVYLDHAGATLYSASQLMEYFHDLSVHVYGNPHSGSDSSQLTSDVIEQIRYRILDHFCTSPDDYSIIFTRNCTEALKIIAESFQFRDENTNCNEKTSRSSNNSSLLDIEDQSTAEIKPSQKHQEEAVISEPLTNDIKLLSRKSAGGGCFFYLDDNHTSVVGMRELAKIRGAESVCVVASEARNVLRDGSHVSVESGCDSASSAKVLGIHLKHSSCCGSFRERISDNLNTDGNGRCLFAFPAQSNFSGTRYPLAWINSIQKLHCVSGSDRDSRVTEDSQRWYVLLDAASFVTSTRLDLSSFPADFIVLSFYKMFGFPTGLGCLLVRNKSSHTLSKSYFSGGTVKVAITTEDFHVKRDRLHERYEDGTPPFLEILSLRYGFDALDKFAGGTSHITHHTFELARYVYHCLANCCHANGQPVAKLYCDTAFENPQVQGPIVNFNLLKPNGEFYGYAQVEKLALVYGIQLRTGCFCNTGACQHHLAIDPQQVKDNYRTGHVCGDDMDLINDRPTGSVRISFGYMSTLRDAQTFLTFISECFVDHVKEEDVEEDVFYDTVEEISSTSMKHDSMIREQNHVDSKKRESFKEASDVNLTTSSPTTSTPELNVEMPSELHARITPKKQIGSHTAEYFISQPKTQTLILENDQSYKNITLTEIYLYPVKSCGAFQVAQWSTGPRGLVYDREWMIVTETGSCLTQKREPLMCLIRPQIDIDKGLLRLTYPGAEDIDLTLEIDAAFNVKQTNLCRSKICADTVKGIDCGDEVADWLESVLSRPGLRLVRQTQSRINLSGKGHNFNMQDELSLANEAQFLLINKSSVVTLCEHINKSEQNDNEIIDVRSAVLRFRANLVISGAEPFIEEDWSSANIGTHLFKCMRTCNRCQMICIDQDTGIKTKEPLKSLIQYRNKKAHFGVLMCHVSDGGSEMLKTGQKLLAKVT